MHEGHLKMNLPLQVDGSYRLHFTPESQWVVSRLGSPVPEMEVDS